MKLSDRTDDIASGFLLKNTTMDYFQGPTSIVEVGNEPPVYMQKLA
jgi:hypothetical protein